MSLSSKDISSIQKAGQAVHSACESISEAVRTQGASMLASVSTKPFDDETEQAIGRFKTLSRLNQGLAEVEAKLQELFAMANDLANPASNVIALPSPSKRKASNAAAVDVAVKPAKAAKAPKKTRSGRKASLLTTNDQKLLAYLQGAVNSDSWTHLPGSAMAHGSGMPVGSIAFSLKKLMTLGAIKAGTRGHYQLGTAVVAPADSSSDGAAPAKKTRKAKASKAEAAGPLTAKAAKSTRTEKAGSAKSTKVPKVVPAKRARATPAKKSKAAKVKIEASLDQSTPPQIESEATPI